MAMLFFKKNEIILKLVCVFIVDMSVLMESMIVVTCDR